MTAFPVIRHYSLRESGVPSSVTVEFELVASSDDEASVAVTVHGLATPAKARVVHGVDPDDALGNAVTVAVAVIGAGAAYEGGRLLSEDVRDAVADLDALRRAVKVEDDS